MATTGFDRLEYYRQRYAELKPGWEHATARYQRWVAQRLTPTSKILDLGCGRGGIVERLHTVGRWTGIDPDNVSIQEHRLHSLSRGQGNAERLPFCDAAFDIIVSSWVLEHLPNPDHTFAEVYRVLHPGGHFIFVTPNARHPIPQISRALMFVQQNLVSRVYGRTPQDTFPVEYQANTLQRIETIATRVGLRLVKMELVDDPAYLAWNALTFRMATLFEQCLPARWKVHLVGEYVRTIQSAS